jgi:hypothetical protein
MLSSPGSRSKICEALDRKIGKPRGQIVGHGDVDTGFDDAEDGRDLGPQGV